MNKQLVLNENPQINTLLLKNALITNRIHYQTITWKQDSKHQKMVTINTHWPKIPLTLVMASTRYEATKVSHFLDVVPPRHPFKDSRVLSIYGKQILTKSGPFHSSCKDITYKFHHAASIDWTMAVPLQWVGLKPTRHYPNIS